MRLCNWGKGTYPRTIGHYWGICLLVQAWSNPGLKDQCLGSAIWWPPLAVQQPAPSERLCLSMWCCSLIVYTWIENLLSNLTTWRHERGLDHNALSAIHMSAWIEDQMACLFMACKQCLHQTCHCRCQESRAPLISCFKGPSQQLTHNTRTTTGYRYHSSMQVCSYSSNSNHRKQQLKHHY